MSTPTPPSSEPPPPDRLVLRPQEVPLTAPESCRRFRTGPGGGLITTPGALAAFGMPAILACLYRLQWLARRHHGLDYLQVFEDPAGGAELWFIEDAPGTVTALLPDER